MCVPGDDIKRQRERDDIHEQKYPDDHRSGRPNRTEQKERSKAVAEEACIPLLRFLNPDFGCHFCTLMFLGKLAFPDKSRLTPRRNTKSWLREPVQFLRCSRNLLDVFDPGFGSNCTWQTGWSNRQHRDLQQVIKPDAFCLRTPGMGMHSAL